MQATITFTDVSPVELHKLAVAFRDVFFSEGDAPATTTHECAGQCQAEPEAPEADPYTTIMNMLTDPRFQYRSVKSLAEKAGVRDFEVPFILNDNHAPYEFKTRRSDGATLITLVKEPVVAAPAVEPVDHISNFDKLLDALNHPTYVWRTVEALVEKTGYSNQSDIENALALDGIDYSVTYRNSDGKTIIALDDRI